MAKQRKQKLPKRKRKNIPYNLISSTINFSNLKKNNFKSATIEMNDNLYITIYTNLYEISNLKDIQINNIVQISIEFDSYELNIKKISSNSIGGLLKGRASFHGMVKGFNKWNDSDVIEKYLILIDELRRKIIESPLRLPIFPKKKKKKKYPNTKQQNRKKLENEEMFIINKELLPIFIKELSKFLLDPDFEIDVKYEYFSDLIVKLHEQK